MKRTVLMAMAIFFLAAVLADPPVQAEEGKQVQRSPFSFILPKQWRLPWVPVEQRKRNETEVLITKDGVLLDRIELTSRPVRAPFGHTRRLLQAGMQPFEMAEVVINDLQLNATIRNLKIYENKPVTICGRPGFRVVFSYTDNGTLSYKAVYYGFQRGANFIGIRFDAPTIHYFDTYLAAFENIAKSVTIATGDEENKENHKK